LKNGESNMMIREPQVLYDAKGHKTHVVLPFVQYQAMIELMEDALDLKAMKEVESEKSIPWKQAMKQLSRRKR